VKEQRLSTEDTSPEGKSRESPTTGEGKAPAGSEAGSATEAKAAYPRGEMKRMLEEAQSKVDSYLANWQRAEADFLNYKKRAEQERDEMAQRTLAVLILDLLPVLDDLERAFNSLPPDLGEPDWMEGIRLIYRKLQALLERRGLAKIKAEGQPFDPSLHEAVRYDKGEEGVVLEELQKGYRLSERVLRPSLVVVGRGKDAGGEEITEEQEGQSIATLEGQG
jgi:molecular chaperone GrpE